MHAVSRVLDSAWRLLIVIIALAVLRSGSLASAQPMDFDDVVAKIRANETRYQNIEVKHRTKYVWHGFAMASSPDALKGYDKTGRTVWQNDQMFVTFEQKVTLADGKADAYTMLLGCDGKETRVRYDKIAEIHDSIYLHDELFAPHMLLFANNAVNCPSLPKYIAKTEIHGNEMTWELEADDMHNGLPCRVMRATASARDGDEKDPRWVVRLWIAPERNYLPVKVLGYRRWNKPMDEHDPPMSCNTVEDWRELAPGLWLPTRVVQIVYDYTILGTTKDLGIAAVYEFNVDEAALDPKYPLELFQDIPFPDDVTVYRVRGGRHIKESGPPNP
jgi:hypothetical protein